MQERDRELYPPRSQTLKFESSCLSNHCIPWRSRVAKIGFRDPISIGAFLSSSCNTAGILQLGKEQDQFNANDSKHSLASDWGLSQTPPPRFSTHRTTLNRGPKKQQQRQGSEEKSVEKCKPRDQSVSLRRSRTIFSPTQLQSLEQEFNKHQYIAGKQRGRLAATLDLTDTQVKVWFQNRRIRFRKQNHKSCQTGQD